MWTLSKKAHPDLLPAPNKGQAKRRPKVVAKKEIQ